MTRAPFVGLAVLVACAQGCVAGVSPPTTSCFVCITDGDCGAGMACRQSMCVNDDVDDAGPDEPMTDAGTIDVDAGPPDTFASILGARYFADYDAHSMEAGVDYDPLDGNRANTFKDVSGHGFHLRVNSMPAERPVVLEAAPVGTRGPRKALDFGLASFADLVVDVNETANPEGGYLAVVRFSNRGSFGAPTAASGSGSWAGISLSSGLAFPPFSEATMLYGNANGAGVTVLGSRGGAPYGFTAGELVDLDGWVVVALRINNGLQSVRFKGVRVYWNTLGTNADHTLNRIRIRRGTLGTGDGTLQVARLVVWNTGITEAEFSRLSQVAIRDYGLGP